MSWQFSWGILYSIIVIILIDLFPPQLNIPLYGPVPQHAILLSLKPMKYNPPQKKKTKKTNKKKHIEPFICSQSPV